jgi:hypothetical protein
MNREKEQIHLLHELGQMEDKFVAEAEYTKKELKQLEGTEFDKPNPEEIKEQRQRAVANLFSDDPIDFDVEDETDVETADKRSTIVYVRIAASIALIAAALLLFVFLWRPRWIRDDITSTTDTIEETTTQEETASTEEEEPQIVYVGQIEIDEEHFPDPDFRRYVAFSFDKDKDNTLNYLEISEATEIFVEGHAIEDMKGLEFFPSLKILSCSNNKLTSLDVSHNPNLQSIYCNGNDLVQLDVSKNPELFCLECQENLIEELDVSQNPKMDALNCSANELTKLDISQNAKLRELNVSKNNISVLNLANNPNLAKLLCGDNNLQTLLLSKLSRLESVDCSVNQIKLLDIADTPNLKRLICTNNKLKKLDVSEHPLLERLSCEFNVLEELLLSNTPALTRLTCNDNKISALDVSGSTELKELDCENNKLTSLNLEQNTKLESLWCGKTVSQLDVSNCPNLITLGIGLDTVLFGAREDVTIVAGENEEP